MWFLFYSLCLLLTFSVGIGKSSLSCAQSYGHIHDPVQCNTSSPNCTLYINQTVTFICNCSAENCYTSWDLNGNTSTTKTVAGVKCTLNVTKDIKGVIACHNNDNIYSWNVTVLTPTPPTFLVTQHGETEVINIGGANDAERSCLLCVNCSVRGNPNPYVSWRIQAGSTTIPVLTNESDPSSPYYLQNNGQELCLNDVTRYNLIDSHNYWCTATNVGGSVSTSFKAIVYHYPFPEPGQSVTKGPLSLKKRNVTLTMYTIYPNSLNSYFKVCRYNRSSPDTLISCCYCIGECSFGEVSQHTNDDNFSCQLTTSNSGLYQFKINTFNYPCDINIGYPIEVNDDSSKFKIDFHILAYSLGGLCALLVLGVVGTFCGTRRFYKPRHQYAQIGHNHQNVDDNPVDAPIPVVVPIPAEPCIPYGVPTAASNCSNEILDTNDNQFPNEQTPLLPKPKPKLVVSDVPIPVESLEQKTEHVHGIILAIADDSAHHYTVDRCCDKQTETINSTVPDDSVSSEELFSIDRKNMGSKEQELLEYSALHIGSSHNSSGIKGYIHQQADFKSTASGIVDNQLDKDSDKYALVACNQNTQVRKVVYIIHYSDSKEWITSRLKPILDELDVGILTMDDAVAGQTIAIARDGLVNKADKIIVVFSEQCKDNKKWLHYDLDRAKHKNPDPNRISFIPILCENTKPEDLPKPLDNVIPLKADSKNLKEKLKESIFNDH